MQNNYVSEWTHSKRNAKILGVKKELNVQKKSREIKRNQSLKQKDSILLGLININGKEDRHKDTYVSVGGHGMQSVVWK